MSSHSPFSFGNIVAGIIISVASGVIIAYVIQDARFSPERSKPVPPETSVTTSAPMNVASRFKEPDKEPWRPGKRHSTHPNVVASDTEGDWQPAPGYKWVDKAAAGDFRVVWSPGKQHTNHPHVVASDTEGDWKPASGYKWLNQTNGDFRVQWDPGRQHNEHPNVIAADTEGEWKPAPGYKWVNNVNGDFRVVPKE